MIIITQIRSKIFIRSSNFVKSKLTSALVKVARRRVAKTPFMTFATPVFFSYFFNWCFEFSDDVTGANNPNGSPVE